MKFIKTICLLIITSNCIGKTNCDSTSILIEKSGLITAKLWYYHFADSVNKSLFPNEDIKNNGFFDPRSPYICAYTFEADSLIKYDVLQYTLVIKDSAQNIISTHDSQSQELTASIKIKFREYGFERMFLTKVLICKNGKTYILREEFDLIPKN